VRGLVLNGFLIGWKSWGFVVVTYGDVISGLGLLDCEDGTSVASLHEDC
jgi:hypothetical protein